MNPYIILNIDKNSSDIEIKTAYKKLALKYHPDRNTTNKELNTEKFKEIAAAYEILSDKNKRQLYDYTGQVNTNNINPFEIFNIVFKNLNPKIEKFIKKTYSKLEKNNKDNLVETLKSLEKNDRKEIINDGLDLLTDFLKKKKNNTETASSKKITNNIIYNIDISDLRDSIKLILPIDIYYKYNYLRLKIIDNDKSSNYNIFTERLEQFFKYNDKDYSVKLMDKPHEIYTRKNTYDLFTSIDISKEDYDNGFQLNLFHFKAPIQEFIKLDNTDTIEYKYYGLPIWSKDTYGNLYINFKLK
jgi:DnaJ-class molecular chaperone